MTKAVRDDGLEDAPENDPLSYREKAVNWCMWKVVLPASVLLLFWPFYQYVVRIPESFGHAFAHGDLLLLSVLVLMEAAIEGEHVRYRSLALHLLRQGSMVLAVLVAIAFAVTKYDVMLEETKIKPTALDLQVKAEKMVTYSYLNCVVAAIAVLMAIVAYYAVSVAENRQVLKRVGVI